MPSKMSRLLPVSFLNDSLQFICPTVVVRDASWMHRCIFIPSTDMLLATPQTHAMLLKIHPQANACPLSHSIH